MTSIHNNGILKSGDYVTIQLDCGHELAILVYDGSIFVKTNDDDLAVKRDSKFGVKIKQVPKGEDLDI